MILFLICIELQSYNVPATIPPVFISYTYVTNNPHLPQQHPLPQPATMTTLFFSEALFILVLFDLCLSLQCMIVILHLPDD